MNDSLPINAQPGPSQPLAPRPTTQDQATRSVNDSLLRFGTGLGLVSTGLGPAASIGAGATAFGTAGSVAFGATTAAVGGILTGLAVDEAYTALSGRHFGAALYDWTHGVED
ncbi:MAG: hypothetical protein AAGD10_08460 [Myxococcota bacterium]